MAAINWEDVIAVAPELDCVKVDAYDMFLDYVNSALKVDEWGGESDPMLKLARVYLAAHFGTITTRGASGTSGPVVAESGGGLSRSYAAISGVASGSLLDATSYGQAFRELALSTPARAPIVI